MSSAASKVSYHSFLALTGSCARPKSSRWLQLPLFQRVFAGCHRSLLEDAPSRCYLCNLCIGAWTLTPCWCPYSFLPKEHRPHVRSETFGTSGLPLQCSFYKARYFGAAVIPLYSGSHTCYAPRLLLPQCFSALSSHGVYIRAPHGSLPPRAPDMLTVRFGQLTVRGLTPLKIRSLAGCSQSLQPFGLRPICSLSYA